MERSSKIPRSSHTPLEVPIDLNKQLLKNLSFFPSGLPADLTELWKAVVATAATVPETDEEVKGSITKELEQITKLLPKPTGKGGGVDDEVDVDGDERAGGGGGETEQSGDSAEEIVQFILETMYKRFPSYILISITALGGEGDTYGLEHIEFKGTKHDEHKLQFGGKLDLNPVTKLAVTIVPGKGEAALYFEVAPPFEKAMIDDSINTPALPENSWRGLRKKCSAQNRNMG